MRWRTANNRRRARAFKDGGLFTYAWRHPGRFVWIDDIPGPITPEMLRGFRDFLPESLPCPMLYRHRQKGSAS